MKTSSESSLIFKQVIVGFSASQNIRETKLQLVLSFSSESALSKELFQVHTKIFHESNKYSYDFDQIEPLEIA